MHMADALISPAVGGSMWVLSAGLLAFCAKKVGQEADDRKVPLMGVLGAFIFASQMINFSIPATGSSGHLGGGLILSILLGPCAAFIVMASILTVQALFFADGGLLALGCNIFNLGFYSSFVAYPLVYRRIAGSAPTSSRLMWGSILAAIVGLQLGALSVVVQTVLSGVSELPFGVFVKVMQPIHLAIGLVEGVVTAAVISFVWSVRPEILHFGLGVSLPRKVDMKRVIWGFLMGTLIVGGVLSWFASSHPDGLEWAIFKTSGHQEIKNNGNLHTSLARLQEKTALLPDYALKPGSFQDAEIREESHWPAVDKGTSLSGLVGGLLTLVFVFLLGVGINGVVSRKK